MLLPLCYPHRFRILCLYLSKLSFRYYLYLYYHLHNPILLMMLLRQDNLLRRFLLYLIPLLLLHRYFLLMFRLQILFLLNLILLSGFYYYLLHVRNPLLSPLNYFLKDLLLLHYPVLFHLFLLFRCSFSVQFLSVHFVFPIMLSRCLHLLILM